MDLETENRLAALLMEEARRLRAQADEEGVHVYLQKPNVRGRPNSRFLTATVLGVQQANRAVEVSEMWMAREKELELDARLKNRAKDKNICRDKKHYSDSLPRSSSSRLEEDSRNSGINCSSSKRACEDCYSSDDSGLRDDEVEEFLHSRVKRGRGAVGSRMDEFGPYMSPAPSGWQMASPETRVKEEWERKILGPEKPSFLKSHCPSEDGYDKKDHAPKSSKKHGSKDRSSKEKSDKKKTKEKSSKHRHKGRQKSDGKNANMKRKKMTI